MLYDAADDLLYNLRVYMVCNVSTTKGSIKSTSVSNYHIAYQEARSRSGKSATSSSINYSTTRFVAGTETATAFATSCFSATQRHLGLWFWFLEATGQHLRGSKGGLERRTGCSATRSRSVMGASCRGS